MADTSRIMGMEDVPVASAGGREAPLEEIDGAMVPRRPATIEETGIAPEVLLDLTLKLARLAPHFATDWAAARLCLSVPLVSDLLEQLTDERLLEVLGAAGPMYYRYAITKKGQERAEWLMDISGYVGPAPVSLEAYTSVLEWQLDRLPSASPEQVARAISELTLPEHAKVVAGLAISSCRSLLLYGPAGTGKTTVGRVLHSALRGHLWIPHCIGIDSSIVRIYDPQTHEVAPGESTEPGARRGDDRWICVKRPFVAVGGEVTLESLDLIYTPARGYYEAPLHVKANGGTFLLDDLGCQRVEPHELLNRWIVPLEHQVDYLTLQTGQQIQIPFRQILIISTNISPGEVISPGLLRRMGYRLYMGYPTPEHYQEIFNRYAARHKLPVPEGLVERLLRRYQAEERPMRGCEPRDLIERARDICHYRRQPVELSEEVMELAWSGYFLNQDITF